MSELEDELSRLPPIEVLLERHKVLKSLEWKNDSFKLLMTAYQMGKINFGRALQQVGREGSVARSVPGYFFKEFSDYIYDNMNNFTAGKVDIFKIADKLKKKWNYKAPISYVSKIAHIINPWEYPLIWDSNVRTILHIGEHDKEAFKTQNELYKEKVKELSREEAYRPDANIWAQVISN